MNEISIFLCGVILFLAAIIVVQIFVGLKERRELLDRLMAQYQPQAFGLQHGAALDFAQIHAATRRASPPSNNLPEPIDETFVGTQTGNP